MSDPSGPVRKPRRGVNGGEAVLGDGQKVELADLRERVAGRFLDPVLLVLFVLGALIIVAFDGFLRSFGSSFGPHSEDELASIHEDVQVLSIAVSLVVFGIIVPYEMAAIGLSGRTWGKRRWRVRVVTCSDGAVPSESRALVRALVPAAAGVGGVVGAAQADFRVPALGGLALWLVVCVSAMWGRSGRGWHDMAAGTVVVIAASPDLRRTPTGNQRQQPTSSESTRPDSKSVHDSGPSWGMVSDYYGPRRSAGAEEHTSGTAADDLIYRLGDYDTLNSGDSSAEGVRVAGLVRRAAARAVDALFMLVAYALTLVAVGLMLGGLALASDATFRQFRGDEFSLLFWLVSLWVPSAWLAVRRYEVVSTSRRGQTLGKQLMGICVVRHVDPGRIVLELPERASSNLRWMIPHGAVSAAAVMLAVVIYIAEQQDLTGSEFLLWWLALWALAAVAWAACYVSALCNRERRGWHDKAAGTIVVRATDEVLEQIAASESAAREPVSRDRPAILDEPSRPSSWGMVSDYYGPRRSQGTEEHPPGTGP